MENGFIAFAIQYNLWANGRIADHIEAHIMAPTHREHILSALVELDADLSRMLGITPASRATLLLDVVAKSRTLQRYTRGPAILTLVDNATRLRGSIAAYLTMATPNAKPLALDALYIRPAHRITEKSLALVATHALANIDAWEQLFKTLEAVPDDAYYGNSGLCFRSIHGTLNHILMSDILWIDRLKGMDVSRFDEFWERPDSQLYSTHATSSIYWEDYVKDRVELAVLIKKQAVLWKEFADSLDSMENQYEENFGMKLFHVVNHAMHHRGQVYAALTVLGITNQ
ncbi:hypothetical protein HDU98_003917 [Podochytrium sp. JEL0797]|nr:hypothetical protein HDU98_003917 [Podochytrium sp. JEL0797]